MSRTPDTLKNTDEEPRPNMSVINQELSRLALRRGEPSAELYGTENLESHLRAPQKVEHDYGPDN